MNKIISEKELLDAIIVMGNKIEADGYKEIYPVPMGGYPIAILLSKQFDLDIVNEITPDVAIVDDLIDSGATRDKYLEIADSFYAAFIKDAGDDFLVFPWESDNGGIEQNITRILQYIGDNPLREGLLETPDRVVRSWKELYAGYGSNPKDVLKVFEDDKCDEMVILKNIEFYSTCEHHMLPFFGKIHIGYIPDGKVVGISKLARLTEIFARRLQIQERLVANIADSLMQELSPLGVMVIAEAQHFCMTSRGVMKQNSKMITSAVRGNFKTESIVRNEFMGMICKPL